MKPEDANVQIGARLREAREQANLSQVQLAKELGYESATAVSLIEAGERKLKVEDLQKVAKILHREVAYFLGEENRPADVRVALRADKDLSDKDKDTILHFIDLAKQRRGKR